jgi:hypothetical protein
LQRISKAHAISLRLAVLTYTQVRVGDTIFKE